LRGGGRLEKVLMNLGYKLNVAMRCEAAASVKAAVRMGMGVGILYRNAVAKAVARRHLRLVNVPELKEMGINSFIVYQKERPLAPIAEDFLRVMREQKTMQSETDKAFFILGRRRGFGPFEKPCRRSTPKTLRPVSAASQAARHV